METLDLSQSRVAELSGCDTYLISKLLSGHGVSERVITRILLGIVRVDSNRLELMNVGFASAGLDPLPIPGRHIPSDEEHARRKRGGVSGIRFGTRKPKVEDNIPS